MVEALKILKKYWHYESFRPLQADVIRSALAHEDTLALMPTGGGKSICFQVPGMVEDGVSIVITPLIALMKDQVKQLRQRGILADAIHSGLSASDIDRILDNFVLGDYKFLYVSPERLLTDIMIARTKRMQVRFLVIDEAHCISKWGHDFRPSYLKINTFKTYCPQASLIALTATATAETKQDILKQLEMKKPSIWQMSFKRTNLYIRSRESVNKLKDLAETLSNSPKDSAIVYVKTRRESVETAQFLNRCGLHADFYHAGLTHEERSKRQESWLSNKVPIVVSTNAFGMGIDKADVRFVFHMHIPMNIESYYQEIGRAGRDGEKAQTILFYNAQDIDLLERQFAQKYPPYSYLSQVYQSLCNYYKLAIGSTPDETFAFDLLDFCNTFALKNTPAFHALKLLENQGLLELKDGFQHQSTLQIVVDNENLFRWQSKNEALDNFTKTLLRIYGGELFNRPCPISEFEIARVYKVGRGMAVKLLDRLQELHIVKYNKQLEGGGINFLGQRYDADKLPLQFGEIAQKKEQEKTAIQAMVDFVESRKRCRMAQLQAYFGETNAEKCGHCDNCRNSHKPNLNTQDFEVIGRRIETELPKMMNDLSIYLPNKTDLQALVHYFVDRGMWKLENGQISKT
ncbi:RecQ family ATP-dependent DNA helicase [Marinilongibacter aquaticus]|uniref:RecQ family ATP-dependent DNA helicase n=1 Tax=Marinilongibacter aquaticus TaxID=2975157 RepID=UPI0021BD64C1|nr:RecQ family ATP-dependent DNA helicase [Marinilongibacter aquaticus]UBM59779.1 RecQ family ATP-dependent DNA helicase [Marinilongibacter aquaticus]